MTLPYCYSHYLSAALRAAHALPTTAAETALAALSTAALAARYLPQPCARPALLAQAREALATIFDREQGIPFPCACPIARTAAAIRLCTHLQDRSLLEFADRAACDLLRRARGDGGFYGDEAEATAQAADALLRLALAELPYAKRELAWASRLARHWHGAAGAVDLLCQSQAPTVAEAAVVARFACLKKEKQRPYYTARAARLFARAEVQTAQEQTAAAYAAYALYLSCGEERHLTALRFALFSLLAPLSPLCFRATEAAFSAVGCLSETLFPTALIRLCADDSVCAEGCHAVRSAEALTVAYTRPITFLHLSLAVPCLVLAPHLRIPLSEGAHTLCAVTGRRVPLPL